MNLSRFLVLIGVSILSFTGFLDATIVSTALPSIQMNLHMTVTQLQWVMNAFFLGISAFMASMGRIADIYGRRKVFYVGTIIFGLASIGAGFSTQPITLIFFRAIQGITTAITIPVGIALIQTAFPKQELAKAMGIFAAITGAGLALGPVIGGGLVTLFGWPAVFLVNIPFVIVGFALCSFTVKESRSATEMNLDYLGIFFLTLTIAALVFAVVEANTYGWSSSLIISSFIVFIVAFILLIITEGRVAHPIMAGDLFKNPVFIASMLFSFAGGGLMSVILFIDPLYLNLILNLSIWMTGVFLFVMPLVVMTCSPVIGHINQRIGPRKMMLCGCGFFFFAALGQLFFPSNLNYFLIIPAFVVFGLGWAVVNQAPAVALGQAVDDDHVSVAMGALFSFYNIGAAVLLAVGVSIFHWQAMQSLMRGLAKQNILVSPEQKLLLENFVKQPDKMQEIIQQMHFSTNANLFKEAFLTGMHSMFYPLIIFIVMAFLSLKYVMRKN